MQKPQAGHDCPVAKRSRFVFMGVLQVSYSKVLLMTRKRSCAPLAMDNFLPAWVVALVKDIICSYKLCLIQWRKQNSSFTVGWVGKVQELSICIPVPCLCLTSLGNGW